MTFVEALQMIETDRLPEVKLESYHLHFYLRRFIHGSRRLSWAPRYVVCFRCNTLDTCPNDYDKGKSLKDFKLQFASDINVAHKTVSLGLFDFRSFLNVGMLLTESEKAKYVRSRILDIVISTINEKTGGGTKYINRRDREYLPAAIQEDNYRKNLTDAINKYVDGHKT